MVLSGEGSHPGVETATSTVSLFCLSVCAWREKEKEVSLIIIIRPPILSD